MDGGFVALWVVLFAFFSFWLSIYVFGLYCGGKWLASKYRMKLKPLAAAALISVLALAVDLPILPFDLQAVHKLTLLFGLWLIHAQPLSIGYWAGYDAQRKADERRWAQNAEAWVSDFEERPPEFMKEFDGTQDSGD